MDEVVFQIIFDLWVFESVVDGCFHKAKLVSDIVTSPFELTSKYTLCFIEGIDCICQLNFISCTWSLVFEDLENFRREEVASDDSKVARSVLWSWFFNEGFNAVKTVFSFVISNYPVFPCRRKNKNAMAKLLPVCLN